MLVFPRWAIYGLANRSGPFFSQSWLTQGGTWYLGQANPTGAIKVRRIKSDRTTRPTINPLFLGNGWKTSY